MYLKCCTVTNSTLVYRKIIDLMRQRLSERISQGGNMDEARAAALREKLEDDLSNFGLSVVDHVDALPHGPPT